MVSSTHALIYGEGESTGTQIHNSADARAPHQCPLYKTHYTHIAITIHGRRKARGGWDATIDFDGCRR